MFMKSRMALSAGVIAAGLAMTGAATPANAQSEPFIGQIAMVGFNFCPRGWAAADGQLLPINQNQALFSLLGTQYGGDGRTTFALPDLRGRVAMHAGAGPGLTPQPLGMQGGTETNRLNVNQLPSHTHSLNATTSRANGVSPSGSLLANTGRTSVYSSGASDTTMGATAIGNTGAGQAVNNMQPYLVINYCVALQGLYPSRN